MELWTIQYNNVEPARTYTFPCLSVLRYGYNTASMQDGVDLEYTYVYWNQSIRSIAGTLYLAIDLTLAQHSTSSGSG
jgi:hypothetical protein